MDISVNETHVNRLNINNSESNMHSDDILIIMRQTTYTKEEAEKLLSELGTIEKCIQYYLDIKPKDSPHLSTNQKIFKSIRDFF
jgi:uncharacterized protein (UPF0371 family)